MKNSIILTISVIFFFGCNQPKNTNAEKLIEINEKEVPAKINESVTLSLEPTVFKVDQLPDSLKVVIINNTNDIITTGLDYYIEKFDGKEWKEISPKDIVFNDLGWTLKPTDTESFEKKLYKDQINYTTGKYRIVKDYLKSDYQKTKQDFNVYAEFEIVK